MALSALLLYDSNITKSKPNPNLVQILETKSKPEPKSDKQIQIQIQILKIWRQIQIFLKICCIPTYHQDVNFTGIILII